MPAIVLSIAGSDPSCGAGIQADLKTFAALGTYGYTVITAITAQNPIRVSRVAPVAADLVYEQIQQLLAYQAPQAIKIGMLANASIVAAVAEALADYTGPIILDPVLVSSSGTELSDAPCREAIVAQLIPITELLTPNNAELAALAKRESNAAAQANALLERGAQGILVTGGDTEGNEVIDTLYRPVDQKSNTKTWRQKRIVTRNSHGTGCTLSAAIAAFRAQGFPLVKAIEQAKQFVGQALAQADQINMGGLHHFYSTDVI